jgi:hypothetical protein
LLPPLRPKRFHAATQGLPRGGTHRGVSEKQLQAYLSKIAYRFNRCYWEKELFDRLVKACVSTGTLTYRKLTATDEEPMS